MFQLDDNSRPQVLLLGNGLNRAFGGISWSDLMHKISVRTDLPSELTCPLPLQAILATNDHVGESMKNHRKSFYGSVNPELMEQLQALLSMGFDDILTTNYSYELEAASQGREKVTDTFLKQTCRNIKSGERVEPKYLLSSCQNIIFNNVDNRIWHIHGEARKPNSMILGHYYYANLLCKMKNYVDSRSDTYASYRKQQKTIVLQSWLDNFVLGDVYILGFGMDFSELDLWWLINRKKREHLSESHIHFYELGTNGFNEKHELLDVLGVEVHTLNMQKPESSTSDGRAIYKEFYSNAISDIHSRMPVLNPV